MQLFWQWGERGLSLKELSSIIGLSSQQISRLEKGDRELNLKAILAFSNAFECKPEDIISHPKISNVFGLLGSGADQEEIIIESQPSKNTYEVIVKAESPNILTLQRNCVLHFCNVSKDVINRPCMVETLDGKIYFKLLKRSSIIGLYDLVSFCNSKATIFNAEIKSARKIKRINYV